MKTFNLVAGTIHISLPFTYMHENKYLKAEEIKWLRSLTDLVQLHYMYYWDTHVYLKMQ